MLLTSPEVKVVCDKAYLINGIWGCCIIKVATLTPAFLECVLRNSLTWITRILERCILGAHWQGIPYTHTNMWSKLTQQRGDVMRVLMKDYSDITRATAKLNLLASPCAWGALQLERCVHVWYERACWAQRAVRARRHPVTVHPSILSLTCLRWNCPSWPAKAARDVRSRLFTVGCWAWQNWSAAMKSSLRL